MNKKTLIAVVVIVVLLLAYWLMQKPVAVAPTAAENELSSEVTGLGEVNLDADLQAIDSEIQKL
jgi:type II secretory pathway component PulM